MKLSRLLPLLAALLLSACSSTAPKQTASPAAGSPWVTSWYAAPTASPAPQAAITQLTLRQILRTSTGGEQLRVRLSNEYGSTPLRIAHAQVAHRVSGARTDAGAALAFGGQAEVSIPAGAAVLSDPVAFPVAAQTDLAVSVYIEQGLASTAHMTNRSAIYFASGDHVADTEFAAGTGPQGTWASWLFLSAVEVLHPGSDGTLVVFGDSISDGLAVQGDQGLSWPDRLVQRLRAQGLDYGVANAGITGNRLSQPPQWGPFGARGLDRLERDVLSQPGAKAVFVLIGINDIGQGTPGSWGYSSPSDIKRAYADLIQRIKARGLKVYLGTLLPFKGAADGYYSTDKEAVRQEINAWIRANQDVDGAFDTALALADPADPQTLRPEYDSGDHLHPNARGAQAIADAVPAAWLNRSALGSAASPR